ncbi:MAG: hypothetical protein K0R54_4294 [Clostridiaceae bacterium]|nr:hypothetical protein [Clostridiaceae bacterium]
MTKLGVVPAYTDAPITPYNIEYHDVATENNGGFNAQSSYDLVTGIGSPKANALVQYIINSNNLTNK